MKSKEIELIDLKLEGKVLFTISRDIFTDKYICYKIDEKGKTKVCSGDSPLELEEKCGYLTLYNKLMKKKLKEEKNNAGN